MSAHVWLIERKKSGIWTPIACLAFLSKKEADIFLNRAIMCSPKIDRIRKYVRSTT